MATNGIQIQKIGDIITRRIRLQGLRPIMFDRYAGDNRTKLTVEQRLYLDPSTRAIGLPAINILSVLTAHTTNSAPKRLRDAKVYKSICNACLSFVEIGPEFVPILGEGGRPVIFGKLDAHGIDAKSGIYTHYAVGRLKNGIPNPKERPTLPLPWAMEFDLAIFPNKEIREQELVNLFVDGGRSIGLGTFRGAFGKFEVVSWN